MSFCQVKNITFGKDLWENFLSQCQEKTFLQSWDWGEFNRAMGDKVWRLGVYEKDNLLSVALTIKISAKRGTFLFVPHGPALLRSAGNPKSEIRNPKQIQNSKFQILNILLEELKKIAKKENASFIRIAPIWERTAENIKIFQKLGFREAPIHIHPEVTWQLNITSSEQDLLMGMRKTTRYLIRQGLKNPDLKVEKSYRVEDIEKFNRLYQETVDRHHFVPFSLEYLKNEFKAFLPDNQVSLFLAKYKNKIAASAMIIFWQDIAFYHHGASSSKYPKIPVSYLLQWEAIKEAKRRGCKIYNFWGIAPTDDPEHPWAGLTLFKMGFGGQKKEYVKTQDLPLSKKYWLTYIFEKLRKIKRGF